MTSAHWFPKIFFLHNWNLIYVRLVWLKWEISWDPICMLGNHTCGRDPGWDALLRVTVRDSYSSVSPLVPGLLTGEGGRKLAGMDLRRSFCKAPMKGSFMCSEKEWCRQSEGERYRKSFHSLSLVLVNGFFWHACRAHTHTGEKMPLILELNALIHQCARLKFAEAGEAVSCYKVVMSNASIATSWLIHNSTVCITI